MKFILTCAFVSFSFSLAQAQVRCDHIQGKNGELSCGGQRVLSFAKPDQKVSTVTIMVKDNSRGIEQALEIRKLNLPLSKVQGAEFFKTAAVQSEIKKITDAWKSKDVSVEIAHYEFAPKTTFYTASDMKTKISMDKLMASDQKRSIASESRARAGGIRGVSTNGK